MQPFTYDEEGYPDILELPFQFWLDVVWFDQHGYDTGPALLEALKGAVDEVAEHDLVYGACFHDWVRDRLGRAPGRLAARVPPLRAGARRRGHDLHRLLGTDGRNTSWSCLITAAPLFAPARLYPCAIKAMAGPWRPMTVTDAACQSTSLVVGRAVYSGGEAHERGEIGWHRHPNAEEVVIVLSGLVRSIFWRAKASCSHPATCV